MSRVAILGGTGKLGARLISRALELGFRVNVLARDPRRITSQNEKLTVMAGNVETGLGLDGLLEGASHVVSALGSVLPVMDRCMEQLVPRLEAHKSLKRFVLISRLGTGDSRGQSKLVSGALQSALPVLMMPVFRDINLAEHRIRSTKLPWTIVRSTRLTDDAATGQVVAVAPKEPPPHRITRADLAEYVVKLLGTEDHLHAELTVGSR